MEEQSSTATAGLLTRSVRDAFPTRKVSGKRVSRTFAPQRRSRNIQQRELFGIHTRFPFDPLGRRLAAGFGEPLRNKDSDFFRTRASSGRFFFEAGPPRPIAGRCRRDTDPDRNRRSSDSDDLLFDSLPDRSRREPPFRRAPTHHSSSGIATGLPVLRTVGIGAFQPRSLLPSSAASSFTFSGCSAARSCCSPRSEARS